VRKAERGGASCAAASGALYIGTERPLVSIAACVRHRQRDPRGRARTLPGLAPTDRDRIGVARPSLCTPWVTGAPQPPPWCPGLRRASRSSYVACSDRIFLSKTYASRPATQQWTCSARRRFSRAGALAPVGRRARRPA
jgi:hypothetical protein